MDTISPFPSILTWLKMGVMACKQSNVLVGLWGIFLLEVWELWNERLRAWGLCALLLPESIVNWRKKQARRCIRLEGCLELGERWLGEWKEDYLNVTIEHFRRETARQGQTSPAEEGSGTRVEKRIFSREWLDHDANDDSTCVLSRWVCVVMLLGWSGTSISFRLMHYWGTDDCIGYGLPRCPCLVHVCQGKPKWAILYCCGEGIRWNIKNANRRKYVDNNIR